MARTWSSGVSSTNWHDISNWTATYDGNGGASVPTYTDDVFFGKFSSGNCVISSGAIAKTIMVSGACGVDFSMPSTTLGVSGTFDHWGSGNVTISSGTLTINDMAPSSAQFRMNNASGNFYAISK